MNILSIDTSTSATSIALVNFLNSENNESDPSGKVLFRSDVLHKRSDSSALFEGIESAVAARGFPDALCIGLGPGSYNGLRAGIAAARAFATARNIPLYALPSPLAFPAPDAGFWALGDARGGHYWIAFVQHGIFVEAPHLLTPSETKAHLASREGFPIFSSSELPGIASLQILTPDAVRLARLALSRDQVTGTPEPLYLKPPHITASKAAAPRS